MRAIVVVMLAGCWHDAPPPVVPSQPDTSSTEEPIRRHHSAPLGCQALVPAMESMFGRSSAFQNQMSAVIDAVTTSCADDQWSTDLIECFVQAVDDQHVNECTRLFSHDQMDHLQQRLMTAMTNSPPQPYTPPPPPAPYDPNAP